MAYISGDKLRAFHTKQALNSPFAQQYGVRGPMSNVAADEILALNNIPTPNQSGFRYNSASNAAMLNNIDGVAKAKGKRPLGSAAEGIAGTAADIVGDAAMDAATSGKGGGLKGFFDSTKANLGNAWGNIKSGKGVAPQYAGLAKGAMGAMAGLKAVQGISEYQNAQDDTEDLVNAILASAAGNDNYRYDLSANQLKTLRQLQNGTFDTSGDFDMGSVLGNLGSIATGAGLGFVTGGGIPGALLGAAGGVVDGVSSGMIDNQNQITADLEGLYNALYESEMRNKAMKRDAAMTRYANSLY